MHTARNPRLSRRYYHQIYQQQPPLSAKQVIAILRTRHNSNAHRWLRAMSPMLTPAVARWIRRYWAPLLGQMIGIFALLVATLIVCILAFGGR
jgi:hypothetical protein